MKRIALSVFGASLLPLLPGLLFGPMSTELKPRTVEAFEAYMRAADARLPQPPSGKFLWADAAPERRRKVQQGKIVVEPWKGKGDIEIPDGLVHDWVGAVFIPGATLDAALARVQDYNNHKNYFKPEVVDSKLISRNGDDFEIFLRLVKKKILTVVLNTNHKVHYYRLDANRCYSRSFTTRVAQVDNAGERDERELPPGKDSGFLWRLNSIWRFEQRDGGVWVECEAISLTRDIPLGLGLLIEPIIRTLPRDSLESTLRATSRMVAAH